MELISTVADWRAFSNVARGRGQSVGLVPTMGALHAGHRSLIDAARARCDVVVVTVFVNPLQFNDPADLLAYPVDAAADRALCAAAGADALVAPALAEMWPDHPGPTATTVHVAGLTEHFEGADRPGHFDGVTTVVAKLFAVTGPAAAFFGEKDYQQLAVIRQMVRDLALAVDVVACPTVRDADGLALSSRNARLSTSGRERALGLSRAVAAAAKEPRIASNARAILRAVLAEYDLDVAYAEVVAADTLVRAGDADTGAARALVAATVDGVRLIDNGPVTLRGEGD